MILLNVCLSDIPKGKIRTAKNGKKYIDLVLFERKETSQYGETHTLAVSKTKEEREANADTVYIGSGKATQRKDDIPF